jgi:predicted MFS family arabinose efflux permease
MQESCPYGSVRGAPSNGCPYRNCEIALRSRSGLALHLGSLALRRPRLERAANRGSLGSAPGCAPNAAIRRIAPGPCALWLLRVAELHPRDRALQARGSLAEGFRYVWNRPDLQAALVMLFLIGTFGLNFPIFISTMSATVFHAGAGQYGLLTSIMAVGSIAGALVAAGRAKPRIALLLGAAAIFGFGCAIMPNRWLFGLALLIIGVSAQTFAISTNSLVQLSTEPVMRGRVMAILLAVYLGGAPIGAPIVGWVADRFGPRWALGVGAAAGLAAVMVAIRYLTKHGALRVRIDLERLRFIQGCRLENSADAARPRCRRD